MRTALSVGASLVWIGTALLLHPNGVFSRFHLGGLVLLGIGIILLVGGAAARVTTGGGIGSLTAGVILGLVGLALLTGFADLGPLFLIAMGLLIITTTLSSRRRFSWLWRTIHYAGSASQTLRPRGCQRTGH